MGLGIKNGEDNKMNKFITEIFEQPKSLGDTLDYYSRAEGIALLKDITGLVRKEKFEKIVFTGMGSSYFVSYAAACLFNNLGLHSFALNSSELLYYNMSLITEKTLLVCISQSGESIEIVKLLDTLPANICCIGITNEEESFLSSRASHILFSKAGREEMTSTKTFTSITMLTYILGWYLAGQWEGKKQSGTEQMVKYFGSFLSDCSKRNDEWTAFFGDIQFMQFIGRGPSFSSVCQSELMFKEAAKIAAAGTLGGEFRHGPMEMVREGFMSVLFASEGPTYNQSIKMASDIVKYNGRVLLITNKVPDFSDNILSVISIAQPDEFLFSVPNIVPVQLLVNSLALERGLEPGNFVNGGKVTVSE